MYLQINDDGQIFTVEELPENVVAIVDNGVSEFIRVNDDGLFERLSFELLEGTGLYEACWEEV